MKKRKSSGKLTINKEAIAKLNEIDTGKVKGGLTAGIGCANTVDPPCEWRTQVCETTGALSVGC